MLQQIINRFKNSAPMLLPEFINNSQLDEMEMYDDMTVLFYSWKHAMSVSHIMDLMIQKVDMVLLYHFIPSMETEFGQELCFYSFPSSDQMFKINMVADGQKMVKDVAVTLYDSLEVMNFDLLDDLERHDRCGTYFERRAETELAADFT